MADNGSGFTNGFAQYWTTMNAISQPNEQQPRCDVAICFDGDLLARFRPIIRHLSVGLIDHIGRLNLVSPAREVQALELGPVRALIHPALNWMNRKRALSTLHDALSATPPTVIHAISVGAFEIGQLLAESFDADLVYQVTAVADVEALAQLSPTARFTVICSSKPLLELCMQRGGCDEKDVKLVRPGVTCRDEPTCFVDQSRDPTILSTSAFVEEEGVASLIEAIRLLVDRGHQFLAFLLGAGPLEHSLRRLVRQLNLETVVTFAQPSGDVLKAMVGADVFVHPAAGTTISARSLQALGQGAAVVSVRGGVLDAMIEDHTAMLCKSGTPVDLADAIERLLTDRELARRLAQNAIEYLKAHHTMSRMAELTAEVYRDLLLEHATFRMRGAVARPH